MAALVQTARMEPPAKPQIGLTSPGSSNGGCRSLCGVLPTTLDGAEKSWLTGWYAHLSVGVNAAPTLAIGDTVQGSHDVRLSVRLTGCDVGACVMIRLWHLGLARTISYRPRILAVFRQAPLVRPETGLSGRMIGRAICGRLGRVILRMLRACITCRIQTRRGLESTLTIGLMRTICRLH